MEVVHPVPGWKVVAATHATPERSRRMDSTRMPRRRPAVGNVAPERPFLFPMPRPSPRTPQLVELRAQPAELRTLSKHGRRMAQAARAEFANACERCRRLRGETDRLIAVSRGTRWPAK